jgi:type IV pilus assembly protein PilC
MKLYDTLFFDLARLLGRKPEDCLTRSWRDSWFVSMFLWRDRPKKFNRGKSTHFDSPDYRPRSYYRTRSPRWKGPFYLRTSHWRHDLLMVTSQLTAMVRTNAPLVKGLEACGREAQRLRSGTGLGNLKVIGQATLLMAPIFFFGMMFGFGPLKLFDQPDGLSLLYFLAVCFVSATPGGFLLHRAGRLEAVFLCMRDDLAAGLPLSEAMRRQSRFFPRLYADMVQAGEESGHLGACLDQLGDETLHALTLGRSLKTNITYVGVVFSIQMLILSFLTTKVLPVFVDVIAQFGQRPSGLMRSVIGFVDGFGNFLLGRFGERQEFSHGHGGPLGKHGLAMYDHGDFRGNSGWMAIEALSALLILYLLFRVLMALRRKRFSLRPIATLFLLIPGIRGVVIQRNLAVIATILDKLLHAGVPLDRALDSAANAELNPLYAQSVRRVRARVLQGDSFAKAWEKETQHGAPILVSFRGLTSLGERSGMLPEALAQLAVFYRNGAEKRIRILSDAVLPFFVLILGSITLTVELTVFDALTGMVNALIESI